MMLIHVNSLTKTSESTESSNIDTVILTKTAILQPFIEIARIIPLLC